MQPANRRAERNAAWVLSLGSATRVLELRQLITICLVDMLLEIIGSEQDDPAAMAAREGTADVLCMVEDTVNGSRCNLKGTRAYPPSATVL